MTLIVTQPLLKQRILLRVTKKRRVVALVITIEFQTDDVVRGLITTLARHNSHAGGHRFESCRAHHYFQANEGHF